MPEKPGSSLNTASKAGKSKNMITETEVQLYFYLRNDEINGMLMQKKEVEHIKFVDALNSRLFFARFL